MDSTRFSANRRFASCIRFNSVHLRLSIMSSPKVLILQAFSLNITSQNRAKGVILSQLSSSHLFIHRVLAKLSNRVVPYGVNYRKLQLLFVVWFLLTLWFCKVRFPADAYFLFVFLRYACVRYPCFVYFGIKILLSIALFKHILQYLL